MNATATQLARTTEHLTVRGIPAALASALEKEKRQSGLSLNQTVINLLSQSLGVRGTRSNGLAKMAGTWSEQDQREFNEATTTMNEIDPDLWK